ncbi:MAG: alpha-1,4-glucan--maltose-1-phosphate maltosyltransferase [Anaerolineae bacterium]|nr:alpha-1,4-glucan--maltose-1-phosphate maltosyltransferase [Gemmatimonadaceae bacterium]
MTPRPKKQTQRPRNTDRAPHLAIECVTPELDASRYPVKRVLGESFLVSADIFKDGHDLISARISYRGPEDSQWRYAPLTFDYNSDRWHGGFPLDRIGRWTYTVEAWTDTLRTWRSEVEKKVGAGQDVSSELLEGAIHLEAASRRAKFGEARTTLKSAAAHLRNTEVHYGLRAAEGLSPSLIALAEEFFRQSDLTAYHRELVVQVDREQARFAAWYEMFPRSCGLEGCHGTFAEAAEALPRLAELGFDVIYLPPIHPIGTTNRKGRNNTLNASADDPGSPWAIGSEFGGHDAVDPRLGTIDDFDNFVVRAAGLGMEIALDYALQCSPDHPWLRQHPDWFFVRPDGSLKYAENPPKKYQDIYPLNFWCKDRKNLWAACRDVLLFWIGHGVHTFRVDNPHTKPFAFWEWMIADVQRSHPEAIFLAEAFTRPKRMKHLAKLGFTQSYTHFTWKNTTWELRTFMEEYASPSVLEYYRGNLFANTPDILHEYLVRGGRNAFRVRLLLAGTLSPIYGIYSGFELCENVPVREGSEEYLDSEKYQLKARSCDADGNINADIAALNRVRRENRALQLYDNLAFGGSDNDQILVYAKHSPGNDLIIVVNVDPNRVQESTVHVPISALGIGHEEYYIVQDLLTGARYTWRGSSNYVRLDPASQPGHLFRVENSISRNA